MTSLQTGYRKQAGPADGRVAVELSELCGDQRLFECPSSVTPMNDVRGAASDSRCLPTSVQHLSQVSAQSSPWAFGSCPSPHDDRSLRNPCYYQLQVQGGSLVSTGSNCDTQGSGAGASHRLQVELSLPSTSPSSSAVLPSHFQAFGSLLHPSPVQRPGFLTQ